MATKIFYFSGEGLWVKGCAEPDSLYGNYSVMINLDDDSRKALKESGLKNQFKDNEFGPYGITFRRPHQKEMKGEIVTFNPPQVVDSSKTEVDPRTVGNGSKLTAKVSVYDTSFAGKKGKGGRLEAVMIKELIKYTPESQEELPF